MFDRSFDFRVAARMQPGAGDPEPEAVGEAEPEEAPPEPAIPLSEHEASLESCRVEALAEGERKGREAAEIEFRDSAEQNIQAHLTEIAEQLRILADQSGQASAAEGEAAARLCAAALRKLFPVLVQAHGMPELEHAISQAIRQARTEPEIAVSVHPAIVQSLADRMQEVARNAGFNGKLQIRPDENISDPDLAQAACRIEWRHGGIAHDSARLLDQITDAVSRVASGATPEDTAPENTAPEDTAPENTAPEDTAPENTAPEDTAYHSAAYDDAELDNTAMDIQQPTGGNPTGQDEVPENGGTE